MADTSNVTSSDFRIEVTQPTRGLVLIQMQMPTDEFNAIQKAMRRKGTMDALCRASQETGLDKVLKGSTYCATCHKDGVQHQFTAKNWFNAFWEALWHCSAPSRTGPGANPGFALQRQACNANLGPVERHDEGEGGGASGGGGGGGRGGGNDRPPTRIE